MAIRKIIGAFLVIFVGVPILFGVTWAVGLIRASVSSEFLVDLPLEIIDGIPRTVDDILKASQDETFLSDPGTRAWFQAAAKTGTSPRELMEATGLLEWMRGELSGSLRTVGEILRGESPVRRVLMDLRPLKSALLHPEMDRFLEATLANLPPCDEPGVRAWAGWASGARRRLPSCRPDLPGAAGIFLEERNRVVGEIENTVQVVEEIEPFPFSRFGLTRAATLAAILIFLIPVAVIVLGAFIASADPAGRLRWTGGAALAGGLPVLVLALGFKKITSWALSGGVFHWRDPWSSEIGRLFMDNLDWIPLRIVDRLFSPVVGVAAMVAVAGIVLLALSSTARSRRPGKAKG